MGKKNRLRFKAQSRKLKVEPQDPPSTYEGGAPRLRDGVKTRRLRSFVAQDAPQDDNIALFVAQTRELVRIAEHSRFG